MTVNWAAFVGVALLAYVIPGPDFAVILRSATRGWRPGVAAALGAQTGLCVHVLIAVAGLSVVLSQHPDVLTAIRIAGGTYLLYLGGRLVIPTLRRGTAAADAEPEPVSAVSTRSAFGQGLFTNVLNPKAVLFFAAVLPQFIAPANTTPLILQVAALGVLDVALGALAWALVIGLGVRLSSWLRRDTIRRWWDRATGLVLAAIGGTLVTARS